MRKTLTGLEKLNIIFTHEINDKIYSITLSNMGKDIAKRIIDERKIILE
jgi:hypothetical protein